MKRNVLKLETDCDRTKPNRTVPNAESSFSQLFLSMSFGISKCFELMAIHLPSSPLYLVFYSVSFVFTSTFNLIHQCAGK